MGSRKKLPRSAVVEIMDSVDLRCCMCPSSQSLPPTVRNGQIHHLDGDPSNSELENLVYLCLDCHEEAGKSTRSARRVPPELIVRRRDRLVNRIHAERLLPSRVSIGFRDALDALVVMDVRSLQTSDEDEWAATDNALCAVRSYPPEIGPTARRAILSFLSRLAADTRFRMPSRIAAGIASCAIDLLPLRSLKQSDHDLEAEDFDLLETAAQIGADLAYDGALYCGSFDIVRSGGEILWRVLSYARSRTLYALEAFADDHFEVALDGARRSGIRAAVNYLEELKKGIDHAPLLNGGS